MIEGGAPRCAPSLKWRAGGGTERGFSQGPVAAANICDKIKYDRIDYSDKPMTSASSIDCQCPPFNVFVNVERGKLLETTVQRIRRHNYAFDM